MYLCFVHIQPSSLLSKTVTVSKVPVESTGPVELWEDDLAGKIQNEYDPMVPNNYEQITRQKRAEERGRDSEVCTLRALLKSVGVRYSMQG